MKIKGDGVKWGGGIDCSIKFLCMGQDRRMFQILNTWGEFWMNQVQMVEIHRVQSEGKDAGAIRSAASEYEGVS